MNRLPALKDPIFEQAHEASDVAMSALPEAKGKVAIDFQRAPQETWLYPETREWLSRLPPRFQPLATARRHPYILNRLASLWNNLQPLTHYVQELLIPLRKGREGFSLTVLGELTDLQHFVRENGGGDSWYGAEDLGLPHNSQQFSVPSRRKND